MAKKIEFGFCVVEQEDINSVLTALKSTSLHGPCNEISDKELEEMDLIRIEGDYGVIIRNVNNFNGYDMHIRRNLDLIFEDCDLGDNDRIYIETTNDITISNCTLGSFFIEKNHQREINILNSYIRYLKINESILRRVKFDNCIIDMIDIVHSILPYGLHVNYKSSIKTFKLFESLIDNTPVVSSNYHVTCEGNAKPENLYEENLEDIVEEKFILSNSLIIENNIDTNEYPATDRYLNKNRYEETKGTFICGVYRNIKNNKGGE